MKKIPKEHLSVEDINRLLRYDELSGNIYWKVSPGKGVLAGSSACKTHTAGYMRINYKGVQMLSHRVAWVLYYGAWPESFIDHINGNGHDNSIKNLRVATPSQNQMNRAINGNNKSGHKGVHRKGSKWRSQITFNGNQLIIGVFDTVEEAASAYETASKRYHKEFAREEKYLSFDKPRKTPASQGWNPRLA